jgi:hypothetical protein
MSGSSPSTDGGSSRSTGSTGGTGMGSRNDKR